MQKTNQPAGDRRADREIPVLYVACARLALALLTSGAASLPSTAAGDALNERGLAVVDENQQLYFSFMDTNGTFRPLGVVGSGGYHSRSVGLADFDRDGFLDIVTAHSAGNQVIPQFHKGNGDGTFADPVVLPAFAGSGDWAMDMAVGDFDGDGALDVVVNGNSEQVGFYWGAGDGTFAVATRAMVSAGRGMDAADFNGDGRPDIARATYSDGTVRLYLSDGGRAFTNPPVRVGVFGNDPYGLCAGDFDEDGFDDILVNAGGGGDVMFYPGNGDGTFAAPIPQTQLDANNHSAFDAFDYDNDGHLDVVLVNYSGRGAYYIPGNGDGTFGASVPLPSLLNGYSLGVSAPPLPAPADVRIAPQNPTVAAGGTLTFRAQGTALGVGDVLEWRFADETTNFGLKVSHAFATEGFEPVTLRHRSAAGRHSYRGTWVKVRGGAPRANPGGPYVLGEAAAWEGRWTADLDGSRSTDDFGVVSHVWSYGDGVIETNGARVRHVWSTSGVWRVGLTVGDAAGQRHSSNTTATFKKGKVPKARITGPAAVDERVATNGTWYVTFSGAKSSDDVRIWKYRWSTNGGGVASTNVTFMAAYTRTNTYAVQLTVWDHANQTGTTSATVSVAAGTPPVARIQGPTLLKENVATGGVWAGTWSGAGSRDNRGIARYEWTFGDGGTATGSNVTHSYTNVGSYELVLRVIDHANQSAAATQTVRVAAGKKPVARITADYPSREGARKIHLLGTTSTDDYGIWRYRWLLPPREYSFPGRFLDPDQWHATRTAQDERLVVTGTRSDWGQAYFYNLDTVLGRGGAVQGRVDTSSEESYAMVGLKNRAFNGRYTQYPYALYFNNGLIQIYEYGNNRGSPTNYWKGTSYDFRIETLPGAGARYYLRPTGSGKPFSLVWEGGNYADTEFSFGADVHGGTFGFDDWRVEGAFAAGPDIWAAVWPPGPVTLEVVDNAKQTNRATLAVAMATGAPPVAVISGPGQGKPGADLRFDGSASRDDQAIATYAWDFGDGSSVVFGRAAAHFFPAAGDYTVRLTVHDHAGQSDTAELLVRIRGAPVVVAVPWRIVGAIELPHETWSGREVVLKAAAPQVPVPFVYQWNFNDGTPPYVGTATTVQAAYGLEARHTYVGSEGTPFVAQITVLQGGGARSSDTYPLILRAKTLQVEMNVAIDDGLWFLHKNQTRYDVDADNPGGYWIYSANGTYHINPSASVVQAFEINGHGENGDATKDPYVETVKRGLNFLLTQIVTQEIGPQTYGNPDSNGNRIGLSVAGGRPVYELGPVMDALVAGGAPETVARVGPINVRGRTYREIVRDMVDQYSWGQYDHATVGGGWRYGWNEGPDNSASQWGAIGLVAAERYFQIPVPDWVKQQNRVWVQYSRGGQGFGYTGSGDGEATTPSALVQLAWAGADTNDALWAHGERYIASNWPWLMNIYNLYSSYAITKAMRTANPGPVTALSNGKDWFLDPTNGMARTLVDRQRADGSWIDSGRGYANDADLSTPWAIIILSSSLFSQGPVAVASIRPNPTGVGYPVRFDASGSFHQDPYFRVVEYRWDFDAADGLDWEHPDATGMVVTQAFGGLATHTVTLRVSDNATPTAFDTTTVDLRCTLPPHPPTADAGGPYVAAQGEDVQFDGSGSFDIDAADGDGIQRWAWEVDFEQPLDFDDGLTGPSPLLARGFNTTGVKNIGLRVTDQTAAVYPGSGSPDLSNDDFTTLTVYRLISDVQARVKNEKCQLTWPAQGDEAVVYRSERGPNRGFQEIGRTRSRFATYLDRTIRPGQAYYYRIYIFKDGVLDPQAISAAQFIQFNPPQVGNRPPRFTSQPLLAARAGARYQYDATAADPENDPLRFTLLMGPAGMTVHATRGQVRFTPTAQQIGVWPVQLAVQDAAGRDEQYYELVVFPPTNRPPQVQLNGPYAGLAGQAIAFSAAGTLDPDGDPLSLIWNFGDGGSAAGPAAVHTYAAVGEYVVCLFASDGKGGTVSARTGASVTRPNRPPVAVVSNGPRFALRLGETLSMDGSPSFDPDGDPLTYAWTWGDRTAASGGAAAAHRYRAQGVYTGTLEVADSRGGAHGTNFFATVGPANQPPVPVLTIAQAGRVTGDRFIFDATGTRDPEGDPLAYSWNFGDQTLTTGLAVSHVYERAGTFRVTLTVRDDHGGAQTVTTNVPVALARPDFTASLLRVDRSGLPARARLTARLANQGTAGATNVAMAFYKGNPAQGGVFLGVARTTAPLPPGAYEDLSVLWNVPAITSHVVYAVADRNAAGKGEIPEGNESNNTVFATLDFSAAGAQVDLVPGQIAVPSFRVNGQTLDVGGTVEFQVWNQGDGGTDQPFDVTLFEDADADRGYTAGTDPLLGRMTISNVPAPGLVYAVQMTVSGSARFANNPVLVFVDSGRTVAETNEANNIRSSVDEWDPHGPLADVSVCFLRVNKQNLPARATLTARLGNSGAVEVPADLAVAFHDGNPNAGGALLGVARTTQALRPGQFQDVEVAWSNPVIAAHSLYVTGDSENILAERDEANNTYMVRMDLALNNPPVARAGADQTAFTGWDVGVDGGASSDPDGSPLTYRWAFASIPLGSLSRLQGAETPTPFFRADVSGTYEVRLIVNDGEQDSAPDSVSVTAAPQRVNRPPVVNTNVMPGFEAMVGQAYAYTLTATDPDGDRLTYKLLLAPPGMTIQSNTGAMAWTPAAPGQFTVRAVADDGQSMAGMTWMVTCVPFANRPPQITSTPDPIAEAGTLYAYAAQATDFNGDVIRYALSERPAGMTIVATNGRVQWTPTLAQLGAHRVGVVARDAPGAAVTQSFQVVVVRDRAFALIVQPVADQVVTEPTPFVLVDLNELVNDPKHPDSTLAWTASGQSNLVVTISTGRVAAVAYRPGARVSEVVTFLARAPDNYSGFATARFTVRGADVAPVAAIANLSADELNYIRDGEFGLQGTADDPDAIDPVWYRIGLYRPDGALAADLTPGPLNTQGWREGRVPATGLLGKLDLSRVRNGAYDLFLQVRGGNRTAFASVPVAIDSEMKLGRFTFSQEDLRLPVQSLQMTLSRTYDSLNADSGDFGHGWSYAVNEVDIEVAESRTATEDIDGEPFSLRTGGGRDVTLTMPDSGRRATFRFTVSPAGVFRGVARWEAPPGVHATLEPTCSPDLIQLPGLPMYWQAGGLATDFENFDVPGFTLTLRDGTRYRIDRQSEGEHFLDSGSAVYGTYVRAYKGGRVTQITGKDGARLELVRSATLGLQRADYYDARNQRERSLIFQRDLFNRIVGVYLPADVNALGTPTGPAAMKYAYDAAGNLVQASRLVDRADPANPVYSDQAYVYGNPRFPHYLTEIRDALGVTPLRTEYDDKGRVVATIDAAGRRSTTQYDASGRTVTTVDRLGQATLNTYDGQGRVVATADPLGNVTRFEHDANGNLTSQTDPLGRTQAHTYDAGGNRTSTSNALGGVSRMEYDASGNQTAGVDPLGHRSTSAYDDLGNLIGSANALGERTEILYDAEGNFAGTRDPAGRVALELGYDDLGNLTALGAAGGPKARMTYDAQGRALSTADTWINPANPGDVRAVVRSNAYNEAGQKIREIDPFGRVTTYAYDLAGRPVRVLGPGGERQISYDVSGNVIETRFPDGTIVRAVYDAENRVVLQTRPFVPGGEVWAVRTEYDAAGRVVRAEDLRDVAINVATQNGGFVTSAFSSAGAVVRSRAMAYDAAGRAISRTDELGRATRYEYDAVGQVTAEIDALGNRVTYAYDAAGRRTRKTDALGRATRYDYDDAGRLVRTTFADGSAVENRMGADGQVAAVVDRLGRAREFERNPQNQLIASVLPEVQDPESGAAARPRYEYAYDAYGNQAGVRDPKGRVTRFASDAYRRRVSQTLPMGETSTFAYDPSGHVIAATDAKRQTETARYDSLGRMTNRSFFAAGAARPAAEIDYAYDALGRVVQVGAARGATAFAYDGEGRVVRIAAPEGAIQYAYDPATGLRIRAWTDYTDVRYAWDALGRLSTVAVAMRQGVVLAKPEVTAYAYTATGSRDSVTFPNGVVTRYAYDALDRLVRLTHVDASNRVLAEYRYELARDGRRTNQIAVALTPAGKLETNRTAHAYDALGRLEGESGRLPDGTAYSLAYRYDLAGNRIERRIESGAYGRTTRYVYDANDRLLAESNTVAGAAPAGVAATWGPDDARIAYAYDANGALIQKVATGSAAETATYTYDVRKLLTRSVSTKVEGGRSVTTTATYEYNEQGIRVRSDVIRTAGGATLSQESRFCVIDPANPTGYAQVLEERPAGGGAPVRTYTIGDDLIAQTRVDGGAATGFFLCDGRGSVRQLADSRGAILESYRYDAHGMRLGGNPSATAPAATRMLFGGEPFDPELQQYYLRARYYDPSAGRFTTPDPLPGMGDDPASLHKYAYAANDPVNGGDPSGLQTLTDVMAASYIRDMMIKYYYCPIALKFAGGMASMFADKLFPAHIRDMIKGSPGQLGIADIYGLSFSAGATLKKVSIGASLGASLEWVIGQQSGKSALYTQAGLAVAFGNSAGLSLGAGLYSGILLNSPTSGDYAGWTRLFVALTVAATPSGFGKELEDKIKLQRGRSADQADAVAIQVIVDSVISLQKANPFGRTTTYTVGWGGSDTIGITASLLETPGGSTSVQIGTAWSEQQYPGEPVPF